MPFLIVTFLLVSAVTVLSGYAIERVERQSDMARLQERARVIGSALERRANANASYLRAGAALFATLDQVPPARFRRFVSELRLDADFRGAEGIGWAQRVDRDGVPAFDRLVEQEYGKDIVLHPAIAPSQPYAVPVTYLEPDSVPNRRAVGFDMFSEPARREAMLEAERTARPTASSKVTLTGSGAPGFLMYMPVFQETSTAARLEGYVYAEFDARDFLASALLLEAPGRLGIRLYDRAQGRSHLLADIRGDQPSGPSAEEKVMVADHPWVLEVTGGNPGLLAPLTIATLIMGLAVAALLAVLARILTGQATDAAGRLAWLEEQNSIRNSLTRELNHRVKNTLANVLSIIALTKRRASTLDEFANGLDGRIRALSATHDLLTKSEWGSTPIRAVIEAELAPYSRDVGPEIALEGPDVELAPSDALSLGLAIHELATNAAKYGALSQPDGKLSISWSRTADGPAQLCWSEEGGPPVPAERPRGFGMELIEKIVAHELQNPVEMRFEPGGVRCTLTVPVRKPNPFAIRGEK